MIGDKELHKGTTGVYIRNSNNVLVKDISISDCWGDCLYVGSKSQNINVHNCKLINGRMQGVSITSANRV